MRVYFAPCGVGLGHAARCIEIAKVLKQEGSEVLFSTYSDAVNFIRNENLKFTVSPSFGYFTWPDGAVDPWRTLKWQSGKVTSNFIRQIKFEVSNITLFKPDIVVSDSRLSTIIAAKLICKPVITILNQFNIVGSVVLHHHILSILSNMFFLGLLTPLWGLSDKLIIPDFPPPYSISKFNLRIQKSLTRKVIYAGPILPTRPEELPNKETLKRKLGFDERPLIYASVSGPSWERRWLGNKLIRIFSNFPDKYQTAVSLGEPIKSSEKINRKNLSIYSWISNRFELLKACDLIVSRGNHSTVAQALTYGKPIIMIPAQEQTEQIFNSRATVELGAGISLDQRMLSQELILSAIEEILESARYVRSTEKLMELASSMDAKKTVVEIVSGYDGKN